MIRPTVIGQEIINLKKSSDGIAQQVGGSTATTNGDVDTNNTNTSRGEIIDPDGNITTNTGDGNGSSTAKIRSGTDTDSWSITKTRQEGQAETLKNVYKDLSTQIWSKDSLIHKVCEEVRMQLQQHAVTQIRKKKPEFVKIPTVKAGYANKEKVQKKVEENYNSQEIAKPTKDVADIIDKRCLRIEQEATGGGIPIGDYDEEFDNYYDTSEKTNP
jgi:hypothetical protein